MVMSHFGVGAKWCLCCAVFRYGDWFDLLWLIGGLVIYSNPGFPNLFLRFGLLPLVFYNDLPLPY